MLVAPAETFWAACDCRVQAIPASDAVNPIIRPRRDRRVCGTG
jgi:hypothetical protein